MSYYKFQADKIFDGVNFLPEDIVLVAEENGMIVDVVTHADAGGDIQLLHGIITPGFINCHCHLELSHLRSKIPRETGLVNFVSKIIKQRHADAEELLSAISRAEQEMISNGIVAAGDICNTNLTFEQKANNNIRYLNFVEATGFIENNAGDRFRESEKLLKQFQQIGPASIVPHAPYSVSSSLLKLIAQQNHGLPVSMHNQESEAEHEFFYSGKGEFTGLYKNLNLDISFFKPAGKSSLQYFLEKFDYNGPVILVHNLTTTEEDIVMAENAFSKGQRLSWCFCVNANKYISNKLPAIGMFMNHDANIVLGTDSLASNDHLSILEELKTIASHFPEIETEVMLRWATLNGAKALQMDDQLGSFEKGKRPGVVLIENLSEGKIGNSSTCRRIL